MILDVVKKEVSKLLAAGIIYPISDSKWGSLVQVVPKKIGITVVKNSNDELVPTRVQNSWRVCIDYRKLNQATRKDHFHCPSLIRCWRDWQVSHTTIFLMVFLIIFRSTLHLKIKRRQLSPVHLAHLHTGGCPSVYAMPQVHFRGAW